MLRRITYIFLLLTLAPLVAVSQIPTGQSISINVTATVISDSPVELTTLNNMIVSGEFNTEQEIYISPITSPNAGLMRASGRPGSTARLTYIMTEVLSEDNGNGSIILHYEMSSHPTQTQHAAKLIDSGETILEFGDDGLYYLWVGGRINVSNAAPWKYIGQFTLEIEYI